MINKLLSLIVLGCIFSSTHSLKADPCLVDEDSCNNHSPILEVDIGWRRDDLNWKTSKISSYYTCGEVDSHIHFKDIEFYTGTASLKWVNPYYYIRASADYGISYKGNAYENFSIYSPLLLDSGFCVDVKDPVKRYSEVYDFSIAAGYPFTFTPCDSRLSIIPLLGFSYHRQYLKVKQKKDEYPCCCYDSSYCSSKDFCVECCNAFKYDFSSNPFEECSKTDINNEFGLFNHHRTNTYRFTWYGFFVGADIYWQLDYDWDIFAELEGHFLDRCHRKRKSWTGVSVIDNYHHEGWAYGFNGVVGLTYNMFNCCYASLMANYDWWKSDQKHDKLEWKTLGIKLGIAYGF